MASSLRKWVLSCVPVTSQCSAIRALLPALLLLASAMPSAHAAIGRTVGSFDVTSSGTANYTIPIFTPPGPLGMQPSVALAYNSGAGTSYLGKGWSLQGTGFSSIRRCARTVAQDGAATPVQLYITDGYCLDGNRLRLQSVGNYGQSGSIWATEIADFSRITAYGSAGSGPAYWVVERRDGLTYTYGNTADSRVLANGSSTASQWMVNEIRDRNLNKIRFTWKSANATTYGTTHPVKIEWTQTAHNSGNYIYSMDFAYAAGAQPAGHFVYLASTQVRETDLLTSISVSTSGVVSRHYSLTHDTSPTSGARRLTQVKECTDSGAADCFSPTVITYQDGQVGVNIGAPALYIPGNVTAAEGRFDFNGDGAKDIAYKLAGTWRVHMGSHANGYGPEINTGLTGDFRAGRLRSADSDGLLFLSGSTWHVYSWNGSSFVGVSTGITTAASSTVPVLMDADGDGRDDIVYVAAVVSVPFWGNPDIFLPMVQLAVRRNTSTGGTPSFAAPFVSQAQLFPYFLQNPPPMQLPPGMQAAAVVTSWTAGSMGDLDGDKRQELKVQLSYHWCFYMGSPLGCSYSGEAPLVARFDQNLNYSAVFLNASGLLIDINGDGCQDVKLPSGVGLSNCTNGSLGTALGGGNLADWTGDGLDDSLIWTGGSTLAVLPFLGNGFGAAQDSGIPGNSTCKVVVTDGNGDGLDDIGCLVSGSSLTIYNHNGTNTPQDLVVKFEDGFNLSHSPTYGSITSGLYTPYADASYPNRDVTGDRIVVGSVIASDGVGGTYSTTYSYFGAVENLHGRGFQGFDRIEVLDSRNSIRYVRNYQRAWPYSGALVSETWRQPNGYPLRSKVYIRSSQILDSTQYNERHFIYVSISNELTYQPGLASNDYVTQHRTDFVYDPAHGNPTTVTSYAAETGWSNVRTTTTAYSYGSNPSIWCLALPLSSTVTHAAPGESNIVQFKTMTPDYANCRLSAETVEPNNTPRRVDTSYGYDPFGNVSSVSVTGHENTTMMSARTSVTNWGTTGQFPVSVTDALNQTTVRTFHPTYGTVLTEVDPNGIMVINMPLNTHDGFGRPTRSIRPDGTRTWIDYVSCITHGCENGDPASSATDINKMIVITSEREPNDSLIRDQWTYLDQLDRPIVQKTMTFAGTYSRSGTQYDDEGRVERQTAPCDDANCAAFWVTNSYDDLGRLTQQTRPQSQTSPTPVTTTIAYTGLYQMVTDPLSKQSAKTMDAQGRLTMSVDHNGYFQMFYYDAAGSLKQVSALFDGPLFSATYSYGVDAFQISSTDTDLGARSYTYNSLGDLLSVTDAKSQVVTFQYDPLSRLIQRNDPQPDGAACFNWGTSAAQKNIGALESTWLGPCSQGSGHNYKEAYTYDSVGRLVGQIITADQGYTIGYSYNSQGALDVLTYPASTGSPLQVKYAYQHGMLKSVANINSPGSPYWNATSQNFRGQVTQETLGNGIITTRNFDPVSGLLNSIQSGPGPTPNAGLQNESYAYDLVGNVTQRLDGNTAGLTENFYYDDLHRLDDSTLGGSPNLDVIYHVNGNIVGRSDVNGGAPWAYDATRKHAVTSVGTGPAYVYDPNGNMTTRGGPQPATIDWTSYNYPKSIVAGGEGVTFAYGPEQQYYRQVHSGTSGTETTHYIGGLLEKVQLAAGGTDWRHYIKAAGRTVAILSRAGGAEAVHYPLEDHQGSPSVLTSGSGTAVVRESFGAFGLARDAADWDGPVPPADQTLIDGISRRGYTGHTMLASLGLIHMNGRVYDARIGRFLSPDSHVPDPGLTQSFNRYSYVRNNPLTLIDPSGFVPVERCTWGPSYMDMYEFEYVPLPDGSQLLVRFTGNSWQENTGTRRYCWTEEVDLQGGGEGGSSSSSGSKKSSEKRDRHDYRELNEVCKRPLTNWEQRDLVKRFTVPSAYPFGAKGIDKPGTNWVSWFGWPGGRVNTSYSPNGLVGTNRTTPVHAFTGTVDRTAINAGGRGYMYTHSYGTSPFFGIFWGPVRDGINDLAGPEVFEDYDIAVKKYAEKNFEGC